MEPAGALPPSCSPAPEAAEPPGSPALPAEERPSASAAQEARRRGPDPQGPAGRGARGGGGRAPARRGCEPGGRARRPRVTVDSSKAKTSLEALKISLRQLRWKEFPFGRRLPCDIYWHGVSFHDNDIFSGQVNKFPGMTEMVRKITLSRAVRTMQYLFPLEYNFYPRSWILPDESSFFEKELIAHIWNSVGYLGSDKPGIFPHRCYHHFYLSGNFIHSDNVNTGSKRTFSSILCRLSSKGVDVKKVWSDIISLVIKTIIALTPELKVYYQSDIPAGKPGPTCFQILGFDILLMKNLKPMLLEVNANPSMRIEHEQELSPGVFENVPSPVDEEVKVAVIRDTLRLVDPQKQKKKDIQGFPLVLTCASTFPLQTLLPITIEKWHLYKSAEQRCQTLEHVSDTKEELLDAGPPDRLEHDANKNTEAGLPSLCLKQVFPKYAKQFNYLRVVDRVAALFIRFLGVKGTTKLGPTGFRTFIRNCKLSNSNFSMASVDILYIDITRRWNSMGIDHKESGMCWQAFVEAFFCLAQKKYKSLPLHEQVASLIDFCEYHLAVLDEKRLVCGRGIVERRNALVTCQTDGLQLTPAAHTSLLNRMATASKLADYRNHQY
ncbi:tubulin polyglutamylase TTLL11 isoform X3 [Dromaius novaehollandiae]|uniref:tubulin polyglutamylase TTLL11 isoform X3 n=1 Tax=Dromaius novaehollandiae TaxID=8790 RepID=UPI00311DB05A